MRHDLHEHPMLTGDHGPHPYAVATSVGKAVGWTLVHARDSRAAELVALARTLADHPGRLVTVGAAYAYLGDAVADHTDLRTVEQLAAARRDAVAAGRIERVVADRASRNERHWYRLQQAA